jgi:hypothetical protein
MDQIDLSQPKRRYSFTEFVSKFPPVNMPVTLGEETHHTFGLENEPLPYDMIEQYIHPVESVAEGDPYTEYLPCFSIEEAGPFVAVVWWKAELLNYEYSLATFTPKGQLIQRRIIGFTKVADQKIERAVATINEELEITVAMGASFDEQDVYDPGTSKTLNLEIMANGEIVQY